MANIRIMSNNVWYYDTNNEEWAKIGADCSAENRTPKILKAYKETLPDILGLQECSHLMSSLLVKGFEEFDKTYEYIFGNDTPIFFNRDKFFVEETASFVYDENIPNLEGSFNNNRTKSYCIAVLKEKQSGKGLVFATTHLWWMSEEKSTEDYYPFSNQARTYQLNLLLDKVDEFINKYNYPAVVVGDLNTKYATETLQAALKRGYLHSHDIATGQVDETAGLHYCYPDGFDTKPYDQDFSYSIDHILVKNAGESFVKNFLRYCPDYYMSASDHFPVYIDVEL